MIRILLIIGVLLISCSISGQSSEMYFHELQTKDMGFSRKVNTLLEDSYGFLWIGTQEGLYRFDGNTMREYQSNVFDEASLPNNSINSIIEDKNGNLWIGSESYLIFYNRKDDNFKGYYKDITSFSLFCTEDGTVWVNLRGSGLVKISICNTDQVIFDTHFNYNNSLSQSTKVVNTFYEDDYKKYWIGTPKGIFILGPTGHLKPTNIVKETSVIADNGENSFLMASDNDIHILGYKKDSDTLEILKSYENIIGTDDSAIKITSLTKIGDKILWIGTTNGLIKGELIDNQYSWKKFSADQDKKGYLLNDKINNTIKDRYGNLWIGSLKGVNKVIGKASIFESNTINSHDKSLKNNRVQTLFVDDIDNVWIGYENHGLYKFEGYTNTYTKIPFPEKHITSIQYSHTKDKLLIAGERIIYELSDFNNTISINNTKIVKEVTGEIMDVITLSKDEIWVGNWVGGIDIISTNNKLSPFKNKVIEEMKGKHISVLFRDSNVIWIGTRGKGLFKADLDNEVLVNYAPIHKNSISSNAVLCIAKDQEGLIWIGTRGGGLNKYLSKEDTFISFDKNDGLPSNIVTAIEVDGKDNIWLSTKDGLALFNKSNNSFSDYGLEDGIIPREFIYNSSASDKLNNNLFFGYDDGFYKVKTEKLKQNNLVSNTVITKVRNFGKETKIKNGKTIAKEKISLNPLINDSLQFSYTQNNIAFEFSSLDLTAPNKNEYAYMLQGVHDYWIHAIETNRNANYNSLDPGTYTFKVKSSNSDGIWNETPATITFTILPPFWRTTVAYLIYSLIFTSLIIASIILIRRWYRLKKNLVMETISREKDNEHNRMKMVFFTDISHELRTPLTLILGTIEKVITEKQYKLSLQTAQRIFNNSLRMNRLINQIMDIRKHGAGEFKIAVQKLNVVNSINKAKNAFNDFAKIYHINYSLKVENENIIGWFDPEILEKILFNLLSNAFKYTPEKGKIIVTIDTVKGEVVKHYNKNLKRGKYLVCIVRDNGIGIPEEDLQQIFDRYYQATKAPTNQIPGTGIGMELVHKLVETHHGAIAVESKENVFTEFTFYLPIEKKHYKSFEINTSQKLVANESEIVTRIEFAEGSEPDTEAVSEDNTKKRSKQTILIVDDNKELRDMVKNELYKDFTVLQAANGKEGYEIAITKKPELIITDIMMPVEDGISFLKRVKANKEISHIPVFMLTAKGSYDAKIQCTSIGADDFIEKPFSLEFFKWKVRNTLLIRKQLKEKYSKVITAEPSELQLLSNDEKFIQKLVKIIENSLEDNLLGVEYLASEAGMSRANLYRKLQSIINDTPVNFIKQIRLKRAVQLLKDSGLYISEVAYMTGFNNTKYFSKCFHKEFGMSPSDYAKKIQEEDEQQLPKETDKIHNPE